MPLQIRRGTEAERLILAAPLVEGELLWITDDQKLYIGNGTTPANTLSPVTGYDDNDAVSAVADAFAAGSQTGISFSYNGVDALSATVSNPLLNLDGTIKAHVLPDADETYDLGSAGSKFRDLYLSGTSLYLGTAQITASGSAVNLPAGSTVDGISIASIASGVVEGSNYRINVVGNDSSLIVDSDTNSITANNVTVTGNIVGSFIGDIKGSVFGDDSTIIIDGINNTIRTTNLTFAGTNISSDTNEIYIGSTVDDQSVIMYSENRNFFDLYGTSDIVAPWIEFRVSKGTMDSPTVTNDQTVLSGLLCYGHDGTDYIQTSALAFKVSGTTTTGVVPSEFFVVCESDTIGSPSVLSFTGNQGILSAPIFKTGTYANDTARDAAIPAPQAGMLIFNQRDDSTGVPQFQGYDGTNWVDLH